MVEILSLPGRLTIDSLGIGGNEALIASSPRTVRVPVAYAFENIRLSLESESRKGVRFFELP
jgi:hypothetical protein